MNAGRTIRATLDALAQQDFPEPFEVIVVDDGSSDETPTIVAAWDGPVRLVRQERQGPGPARNRGAAVAQGAILAFTDADCVPTASWLRVGVAAMDHADLVQGRVRPDPGVPRGPFDHTVWVLGETGLYETANLFVRTDLFRDLDGFEDFLAARIGKPLAEDVWLGWRLRRAGARTKFCADALVHHAVLPRKRVGYLTERLRAGYFPLIAQRVPELRDTLFWRRWFLSSRSAAFDAAAAGLLVGRSGRRLLGGLLLLPYLVEAARRVRAWPRRAVEVLAVDAIADLVTLVALLWGSVRARTLVL